MERVTGIGGVFIKARNPDRLYQWYEKHLGIKRDNPSAAVFHWRHAEKSKKKGMTVWSLFPQHSDYFGAGPQTFMMNYQVDDLMDVLKSLRAEGVVVDPRVEESEYGKFGWVVDPEGNRIELWQAPSDRKKKSNGVKAKRRPAKKKKKK